MKQWSVIFILLFWLAYRLAVPVDLIKSDLGRHIKNGELIMQGYGDLLYKNYYSYTYPQYPFINQHWLFGVFSYLCWHYAGFNGLSLIYLTLELFTFYVFFRCCLRYSSFSMAYAFALLSIPLVSFRSEIRPEGISYLFCGLFWWFIDSYQRQRLKPWFLMIILSILQIIWVNTHVFFIMGPILTGIFWWRARIIGEKQGACILQKLFFLLLGVCLVNPSGIAGALVPLQFNKAYSYPLTENQPVFYYLNLKMMLDKSFYLYFLTAVGMLAAPLFFVVQREGIRKNIHIVSLAVFLSFLGLTAIRLITPFGFFWMPLSTYVYSRWLEGESAKARKNIETLLIILGVVVSLSVNCDWKQSHGIGILPGNNASAEFFKRERISGPIFNNYNIGGYLIFYFSPDYKFFVDNRQVAFPDDFFSKTYVPMQLDEGVWKTMEQKYQFNAIFYNPEISPWGSKFLINRYQDPNWVLVYYSKEAVIFLKRNERNAEIIRLFGKKVKLI